MTIEVGLSRKDMKKMRKLKQEADDLYGRIWNLAPNPYEKESGMLWDRLARVEADLKTLEQKGARR